MPKNKTVKDPKTPEQIADFIAQARAIAEPKMAAMEKIYAKSLKREELADLVGMARHVWEENLSLIETAEDHLRKFWNKEIEEDLLLGRFGFFQIAQVVPLNNKTITETALKVDKFYEEHKALDAEEIKAELARFDEFYDGFLAHRAQTETLIGNKQYFRAAKLCLTVPQYNTDKIFNGLAGEETGKCRQYDDAARRYHDIQAWVDEIRDQKIPRARMLEASIELNQEALAKKREELEAVHHRMVNEVLSDKMIRDKVKDSHEWFCQVDNCMIRLHNATSGITALVCQINDARTELEKSQPDQSMEK